MRRVIKFEDRDPLLTSSNSTLLILSCVALGSPLNLPELFASLLVVHITDTIWRNCSNKLCAHYVVLASREIDRVTTGLLTDYNNTLEMDPEMQARQGRGRNNVFHQSLLEQWWCGLSDWPGPLLQLCLLFANAEWQKF